EFIDLASKNIANNFLQKELLEQWAKEYDLNPDLENPKSIGITMAGNIPLVGFHDFLSVFISGHKAVIKASSKDEVLIKHLVQKLTEWSTNKQTPSENKELNELIVFQEMLKGCDAYIATGSNNSARYFEYYFKTYPHIIRRNRTSVAVLDDNETTAELEKLADDVHLYFGMGCRNVTKIFVPKGYDFIPMLSAFKKYDHFKDHNRSKR